MGPHASARALVADIEKSGSEVGDWARGIASQVAVSVVRSNLRLVAPSVAELGFTQETSIRDVHARAIKVYGLELCPSEVGLQLRRQYVDQPEGEELLVAMEAIKSQDGLLHAWGVECVDGERLIAANGNPGHICDLKRRLVFVVPHP